MERQAAVWMDGHEARVFHVRADGFDEKTVESPNFHVHRHPKDQLVRTHAHPDDEHRFFRAIAEALAAADQILVLGPSVTKLHFLRFLQKNDPALESRIMAVETADHPTDRQIIARVHQYFYPHLGDSSTAPPSQ